MFKLMKTRVLRTAMASVSTCGQGPWMDALLGHIFGQTWIGGGGPIVWPAPSPDLTPLDYSLWGYTKSSVYKTPVNSEEYGANVSARMLAYKVLAIVCTRTWYVGTVYVLKSLVVTSSTSCMWTQNVQ